ncbi:AraC family transcriptional regulator [Sporanaerobium hydrogeniformans]|uniref:AraC family transcriptional regulator n=1 Tax=Sporanaerobium hydrogeniformans TaxID=3072179 RepID=A0AC61DEQ7_9FIRM|nr:AraC family transcriptional regulator [Sporanaerobium hydrogeniformans]PHV71382.1 AraC family transcriptional regulator [Sporanaerobium hydrogeniformans]
MRWTECISDAITFIEDNIAEEITVEDIAKEVHLSPFYFQKGFAMLCDFTVSDYIRNRRLALAGSEIAATEAKIIDVAVKYGYDSPDSFTKAFTRFHGCTPTAVRKDGASIKSFAPISVKFTLEGGYSMDYKIIEKEAFTVVGLQRTFKYDEAMTEVPKLWSEFHQMAQGKAICPMYGINADEFMEGNEFEYTIADNYDASKEIPDDFTIKVIPKFTWAVFTCKGKMPDVMQKVNKQIYSEWLPNCKEYEIAAGYCIEMYEDPTEYPNGVQDENYYSEIWIPVKRK